MVSPVVVVIFIVVIVYILYKNAFLKPNNFPPGPWSVPIFGGYLYMLFKNYNAPYKAFTEMTKIYNSKIIGLYIGTCPTIVVGDPDIVREILFRPEFDGRPDPFAARIRTFGKRLGIFFTDGPFWLHQRRFMLRYMRDFGFGRRMESLESGLADEMHEIIKMIDEGPKNETDKAVVVSNGVIKLPDIFYAGFVNNYISILLGSPLSSDKRQMLQDVAYSAVIFQRAAQASGGIISTAPWLRFFAPNMSHYKEILRGHTPLLKLSQKLIEMCKENLSEDNQKGFIDVYLKEAKIQNANGNMMFSDQQLLSICADLMMPSGSAVSTTLAFVVEYLINYPDIQEKVYEEIRSVVGHGRLPTLDDRPNLPYCDATLREVLRITSFAPLSLPHSCLEDTTLGGYDIPKGTMILTNLWEVHHTKELWGDPENFRPERFLQTDGRLIKKDLSLPFGIGRRVCAGETFSRNNMFLFMVGLFQNYQIGTAPGMVGPDINNHRTGGIGITLDPYWAQCKPRKF